MNLDKAIQERKSTRKFSTKKPNWKLIIECINSVRFIPTAGGNFSLRVIMVDDSKIISQIAKASQQDFIQDAQFLVVFLSDKGRTTNLYGKRGEIYIRQQAGAAMQNFQLKITESKLETCWIGHFSDSQVKRALKIPADIDIEGIFPIGFESGIRSERSKYSKKIELDKFLYFNQYKNRRMKSPKIMKH
jgi:nitroreductase